METVLHAENEVYQYGNYLHPAVKNAMNGDVVQRQVAEAVPKRLQKETKQKSVCCFCFKTTRIRRRQYIVNFFTNLGIFSLLLGYTFLGSFLFLAIEGGNGSSQMLKPRMLPDRHKMSEDMKQHSNRSDKDEQEKSFLDIVDHQNFSFLGDANAEARAKTVENIWEITVSLNILYRENWTKLAGIEISKFQDELVQRVTLEMAAQYGAAYQEMALGGAVSSMDVYYDDGEWSLAKAFFYSLTVLTTIGYGSFAPKTLLGKAATVGYAIFGIPITMLYLTSVGTMLSRVARGVFTRALCCCLCSNCGYCCYDERRMAEKERRMKLKRQQEEMLKRQQEDPNVAVKEPYHHRPEESHKAKDLDNISWPDTDSKLSMQGLSILAPILLCFCIMLIYIMIGTLVLYKMDNVHFIDGFYFCFMSLSTIGFGNLIPGTPHPQRIKQGLDNNTLWFCSIYIMSGLALTAMCFNVVHDEIVHRLKHRQKQWTQKGNVVIDETNLKDPFYIAS